ncbi:MAG TPA: sigma-54 dependent transcriptional regulator [Candidatus Omnitrophota bacterium]|nr:sigma-54 dependent transcriptional regulator [Candidatus Omnitrophota bacterium]HQO57910.1 sigma-54 dependent transcriptional regulator [Candidatus Omnitrophota bacterium]
MNHKNNKYSILIVDDEPLIRESLYEILRIDGFLAMMASNGEEALEEISNKRIDIVLTDMKLPNMNGLDLIVKIKEISPDTEVIMITGYGSIETAVEAMKSGAYDYVTKPINDHEIKLMINKIVERKEVLQENQDLREIIAEVNPEKFCGMIGSSDRMQRVYHVVESVASSNATILITGESGTGKSLVARAVHEKDRYRHEKPFVEISCGALSETLLESELFGHMKGAFTGAIKDKEGRFEFARGGTVFLDEIDAFSPSLQVKLLRVLQDGVFERVGDNVTRKTDARIIVATNQELKDLVLQGDFREDLFYRINVINITMPPLRERKDDIDLLVNHFIERYNRINNKNVKGLSDEVRKLFLLYNWPGNIRELENAIEGAVVMSRTDIINKRDIPNVEKFSVASTKPVNGQSLKKVLEQPEKDMIISVLEECNWNRNRAAAVLGINRTTLYNKMKKFDISFNRP